MHNRTLHVILFYCKESFDSFEFSYDRGGPIINLIKNPSSSTIVKPTQTPDIKYLIPRYYMYKDV
jgi:hypothetical protein